MTLTAGHDTTLYAPAASDSTPSGEKPTPDRRDYVRYLALLLQRLQWTGTPRMIEDALPWGTGGAGTDMVAELCDVAARLGYASRTERHGRFDARRLRRLVAAGGGAVLYLPDDGPPAVLARTPDGAIVRQPDAGGAEAVAGRLGAGTVIALTPSEGEPAGSDRRPWVRRQLAPAVPLILAALTLTLCANMLALTSPLFVMAIYDKVIAAASVDLLFSLGIGAVGAMVFELLMRRLRSKVMTHAGNRLGYVVGNAVLGRLLDLPSQMTERVTVAAQVARVKDLDRVRDLLTGPLAQACLDLPFAFIFLAVIALIGGWLVIVPIIAGMIFAIAAIIGNALVQSRVTAAATASARRQELLLEIVDRMRPIRAAGSVAIWRERYGLLAARTAEANFRNGQATTALSTFSQAMGTLAGLATLAIGIDRVLAGTLTTGGLIGVMMLVWRTLGPMQSAFTASTRFSQLRASLRQIETLMATPPERAEAARPERTPDIQGRIVFSRVTFRYGRESEPILANLSFQVEPGEVVAVVGRNGGGKSTVLKLVSGLYTPQGGSVRIDGRDLRQFDPMTLRRSIAFVPQMPQFFDGTLAENLRLAAPAATDEALRQALDQAEVLNAVEALEFGLETRFDTRATPLPAGLLARLSLARIYLRDAPIVLLDEPATSFDFEGEFAFTAAIEALRGRSTVFFVTHRRGHLAMADKVLIIENGSTRYFGPADKIRNRIPRGMI